MQKIKKIDWVVLAILLVNISLIAYCFSLKTDFHVDEYFSLGHSNNNGSLYLFDKVDCHFKISAPQCIEEDVGHNYLTVQKEDTFNYQNVLSNLSNGVHPPLYYFITHTIYSFFPDTFNKWLSFPINIVFFVLTFWVLYKFARDVFGNRVRVYLTLLFFGFCLTTIDMAVFIRSYMIQMFIGTFLLYKYYQLIQQEKVKFATLFQIFLFSYLGFLTHYYFLIFCFINAFLTCFIFVCRRQVKNLFIYGMTMLLSVAVFFISFPASINVILHSSCGVNAHRINLASYYLYHLSVLSMARFLMEEIFAFEEVYPRCLFLVLSLSVGAIVWQNNRERVSLRIKFLVLCVVSFMFMIGILSPGGYWYDRYFSPIVPVLCMLIIYFFVLLMRSFSLNKNIINAVLAIVVFLNVFLTNWQERSGYYLHITENTHDALEKLESENVILLSNHLPGSLSFVADYSLFNSLCVFDSNDIDKMDNQIREGKFDYLVNYYGEEEKLGKIYKMDTPDYIEKNVESNVLTYLTTFKKGIYIYKLYKITPNLQNQL